MGNSAHPIFSLGVRALGILLRIYMRAFTYIKPVENCRTEFGALMRCNSRDFLQRRVRFFRVYEHDLTYYTLSQLRYGDLYVDIGANVGYFSLLASRCVGDSGRVISVEADPATFRALLGNLELNGCGNVSARNVAATATACSVNIRRSDLRNSGSNTVEPGAGPESIAGLPFREIVGPEISRVRFIKIDIEGSEAPVLNTILDLLPCLPDDLIIASEVSPASADYVARFATAGFRAYAIRNVYLIEYYLIREYLRRFGEDRTINMIPVDRYHPSYADYIFEREC
jgi:FkbM family methyltransferase